MLAFCPLTPCPIGGSLHVSEEECHFHDWEICLWRPVWAWTWFFCLFIVILIRPLINFSQLLEIIKGMACSSVHLSLGLGTLYLITWHLIILLLLWFYFPLRVLRSSIRGLHEEIPPDFTFSTPANYKRGGLQDQKECG